MKHLKRVLIALFIVSVVLLLAIIPLQQIAAPSPLLANIAAAPPNEVRALWVVRDTMTSPEAVKEMVQEET